MVRPLPAMPGSAGPHADLSDRPGASLRLRPPAAPERRWLAVAIAAVAVVAVIAGVIAIATSGDVGAAAATVAPDRPGAPGIEAADPARRESSFGPGSSETGPSGSTTLEDPSAIRRASPATATGARAAATGTPRELCEAACRSGCGLEGPDCARLCVADPRSVHCLEEVGTQSCEAWSRCVLGASCSGQPPRGDASCSDTFACERACRDNIACSCSCMGRMDPAHSLAMTRLSICALFMCADDAACVQARCKAPLAVCEAR
jgi:hypothetical protein